MTKTDTPEARVAALRDEAGRLQDLEQRAQAALDRLATAIPQAQDQVDIAQTSTTAGVLAEAQDRLRKLELERANNESLTRGCASRRQLLGQELTAAEASVARARAKALLPAPGVGRMTTEAFEDAFESLEAMVAQGITPAIQASPREDGHGLAIAADLPSLARWLFVRASRAGIDLTQAKDRGHDGVGPEQCLANVTSVMELLK
jgi:hypothetical protein